MRNECYRLWPLLPYSKLPAYHEQMEREGLRFEKMSAIPFFAIYSRIGREKKQNKVEWSPEETGIGTCGGNHCSEARRYCWDYLAEDSPTAIQDYLDTCEATGWEIAWQFERNKLFRSMEGKRNPAPIHETEAYGKMLIKRSAKPALYAAAAMALLIWFIRFLSGDSFNSFAALFINSQLFIILGNTLVACMLLWFLGNGILDLFKANRLRRYGPERDAGTTFGTKQRKWTDLLTAAFIASQLAAIALFFASLLIEARVEPYWMFVIWPLSGWARLGRTPLRLPWGEEDEAVRRQMKGVYRNKISKKISVPIWIVIIVLTSAGLIRLVGNLEDQPLRSQNLYCSEVYTDIRGNAVANMHFNANDREAGDKVLHAVFQGRYTEDTEAQPILPGETEKLDEITMNAELRTWLDEKPWDECYDAGLFYLVVRRGNEIWSIVKYGGGENESETRQFLDSTGF